MASPSRTESAFVEGFPATMGTNCWIVADGPGSPCIVIDPGIDAVEPLERLIERQDLHPVAVGITHGHTDHTWSVASLCARYGIPAYIHPADRPQLLHPQPRLIGTTIAPTDLSSLDAPGTVRDLHDRDVLEVGSLRLEVRHVPGHTPGSVMFGLNSSQLPSDLFTGDTLFAGSVGRTDLPGGCYEQLLGSIDNVVSDLPGDTRIRPGHGASSTLREERATNPYLRELSVLVSGVQPKMNPATRRRT